MKQLRAKKGGELGANGEWYEGGKFINTVAENEKRHQQKKAGARRQEVEPYVWEIAPEGKMSLYRMLAGVEVFNRSEMTFTLNKNIVEGYFGGSKLRAERIAAFNSGVRWL